jgi:hypothetical protein
LLHALALSDPQPHKRISFDPGKHEEKQVFASIALAAQLSDRPLVVFSNDQVLSGKLTTYLGDLNHKVTIIKMDGTPETEPIQQCPDRIRDLEQFPESLDVPLSGNSS